MTNIVHINRGKIGSTGEHGATTDTSDARFSLLDNPIIDCLYNNRLSHDKEVTFTRAGTGSMVDRYGDYQLVNGDDFTNHVNYSETYLTGWYNRLSGSPLGHPDSWISVSDGVESDPLGGNNASSLQLNGTVVSGEELIAFNALSLDTTEFYTMSFWIKVISGTITGAEVVMKYGATVHPITWTPDGNWQRISVVTQPTAATEVVSMTVIGVSSPVFHLFAPQYERGIIVNEYIPTAGGGESRPNPLDGRRVNQYGTLIESAATNELTFTENLSGTGWVVSGAAIGVYASANPFGVSGQNIQLTMTTSSTCTITKTVTPVEDADYTASCYVKLISGTVTQISATVGGGASADMELPTSSWTRVSCQITALDAADLTISIVSPTQDAVIIVTGFQLELDSLTSYIAALSTATTRPMDLITVPYKLGDPSSPWSAIWSVYGLNSRDNKYVLSDGNEFGIYYSNLELNVKIGTVTTTFTGIDTASEVGLSYDGTNLSLYVGGRFVESQANAGITTKGGGSVFIGSDGLNCLDGQLKALKVWDFEVTSLEMAYLSSEYNR